MESLMQQNDRVGGIIETPNERMKIFHQGCC